MAILAARSRGAQRTDRSKVNLAPLASDRESASTATRRPQSRSAFHAGARDLSVLGASLLRQNIPFVETKNGPWPILVIKEEILPTERLLLNQQTFGNVGCKVELV